MATVTTKNFRYRCGASDDMIHIERRDADDSWVLHMRILLGGIDQPDRAYPADSLIETVGRDRAELLAHQQMPGHLAAAREAGLWN